MLASLRVKMDPPTSIPVSIVSVATRFMAHSFCDVLLYGPRHRFPVPHSFSSHQEVRCKSHGSGIRVQFPEVTRCGQPLSDLSVLKRKARFLTPTSILLLLASCSQQVAENDERQRSRTFRFTVGHVSAVLTIRRPTPTPPTTTARAIRIESAVRPTRS